MLSLERSIPGLVLTLSSRSAAAAPRSGLKRLGERGVVQELLGERARVLTGPIDRSAATASSLVSGVREGVGTPCALAVSSSS